MNKYIKNNNYIKNLENNMPKNANSRSFKSILIALGGNITAVATFLATNKAAIFLGNIGEDEVIKFFQDLETKYRYGTLEPYMKPNDNLANLFEWSGNFISVNWALLMTDPIKTAAVINGFIMLGATAIYSLHEFNKIHKKKKEDVTLSKKYDSFIKGSDFYDRK